MSESFAELFEASLKDLDVARGSIITGTVVAIDSDWITVNAGLKSEGVIAREEFLNEYADLMVVLDALTALLEVSEADIQVAIQENVERKGLYKNKHYLHWSDDSGYTSNETPQGITS